MSNRTIKFRAWDTRDKTMCYSKEGWNPNVDCLSEAFQSMQEYGYNLMQFTGILDKNGKEVFEGDIVKRTRFNWHCPSHPENGNDISELHEIYWDSKKNAMWMRGRFPNGGGWGGAVGFEDERASRVEIEVVGNIYENPELTPR